MSDMSFINPGSIEWNRAWAGARELLTARVQLANDIAPNAEQMKIVQETVIRIVRETVGDKFLTDATSTIRITQLLLAVTKLAANAVRFSASVMATDDPQAIIDRIRDVDQERVHRFLAEFYESIDPERQAGTESG